MTLRLKISVLLAAISFSVMAQQTVVNLRPGPGQTHDAMVWSIFGNNNYGNNQEGTLTAWTYSGSFSVKRFYIKFNYTGLPSLPLDSAILRIYNNPTSNAHNGTHHGQNQFVVQRVTSSWGETSICYNVQPSVTTTNQISVPASTSNTQDYSIDVTNLVQDQITNGNYGFRLKLTNESTYRAVVCASGNHPDSTKRPELTLYYGCAPPNVNFNIAGAVTSTTTLSDNSIFAVKCNPNGPITIPLNTPASQYTSYVIDYGDGTVVSGSSPFTGPASHSYTPGSYTGYVKLTSTPGCDSIRYFHIHFPQQNNQMTLSRGSPAFECIGPSSDTVWFRIDSTASNSDSTIYTFSTNAGHTPKVFSHPPPDSSYFIWSQSTCSLPNNRLEIQGKYETPYCLTADSTSIEYYRSNVPTAAITGPQVVCLGDSLTLQDSSDFTGVLSYMVDVGNCNPTPQRVWHITPTPGTPPYTSMGNLNGSSDPGQWTNGSSSFGWVPSQTGTYQITLYTGAYSIGSSCAQDSVTHTVVVVAPETDTILHTGCDSVFVANAWQTSSGTWDDALLTVWGCDSTVHHAWTINHSHNSTATQTSCDPVAWQGHLISTSGTYYDSLTTVSGCDSILELQFTRLQSSWDSLTLSGCDLVTFGAHSWSQSGNYTDTLINAAGCDSILYFNVMVNPSQSVAQSLDSCHAFLLHGHIVSSSGVYVDTLSSVFGCDSIVTSQVTLHTASWESLNITACDQYTWSNQTYYSTGTYIIQNVNIHGCDSNWTLVLTIRSSDTTHQYVTGCGSINYSGTSYSTSQILTETWQNVAGCDSLHIIEIDILSSSPITVPTQADICPEDLPYHLPTGSPPGGYWAGQGVLNNTFTSGSSGNSYSVFYVHQSSNGCIDSAMMTIAIDEFCEPFVFIPNAFTPNHDWTNDAFTIGHSGVSELRVRIFTRWGNLIYYSEDLDFAWDGTYNGEPMPEGAYNYRITLFSPGKQGQGRRVTIRTGTVLLIR